MADLVPERVEQTVADERAYQDEWRWWFAGVVVLTAVWALSSVVDGELDQYWPLLPLGVWAAVLGVLPLLPRDE